MPVRLVAPTWALFFVVFLCLQSPLYIQLIFNLEIKHSSSHYYHCALNTINFLFQEKIYIFARLSSWALNSRIKIFSP